ncbi:MAG TPA: tol-pal system protein YbgF [Xanthobacteraceae bacterium]|nr:tol-pal system protein YbgF [Xanthobacteraceae bacterium]
MPRVVLRALMPAVLACGMLGGALPGFAQTSPSDLLVRLDQLQSEIRQLTGAVEQLQYRNQQLEQLVRRMQDERAGAPPRPAATPPTPAGPPAVPARRSDVFDPSQAPNAPGVPRTLGTMSTDAGAVGTERPPAQVADAAPVGAPNGGQVGAPLDLSTMSANGAHAAGGDRALPPPRVGGASGPQLATLPPSQTPRDEFDLAYGYMLRKEYPLAEQAFQDYLRRYPNDRMAGEAQFWLGESMFQRQSYQSAAEAFVTLTKNYGSSPKLPDALLRLGQSLAALQQKDLACSTFAEVGRKAPNAPQNVKAAVERERKRVHC